VTYTVNGEGVSRITADLEKHADVMVAPFGNSLHVSARDRAALEAAIAPYRNDPHLKWEPAEPSLEDVFIDLMSKARDNY
ncbi:MAG TPA: ABC transporter ATP-binding protein, partial [Xanthobacteraceae bacterium]|nr:ABC transporter ATP-binding protein [Xanthobacteraceae bacterium]